MKRILLLIYPLLPLFLNAQQVFLNAEQNDSVKIIITNIGKAINSPFSDFAPVISADGSELFFTSRRSVSEKNWESMEHIYTSTYDRKKKTWTPAKILSEVVNVPNRNNSAIAISNDGQRMLLYRDDQNGNGDIYESQLQGTQWTEPVRLPEPVNSDVHESSASISPDGRTIYFVSEREGGEGGRDIWYCTQDAAGKWGKAINIGEPINTKDDEEGVFIHPDGKTIYFSSKGRFTHGGYDIFQSVLQNGKWTEPDNMGVPINTTADDLFFVIDAKGTTGYYTSSMEGGIGDKDIYEITFTPIKKKKGPKLILLKGIISDELSAKPLESSIEIIDNEKNQVLSTILSNSATGKYLISLPAGKNYGISVKAKGYLFHSENFNVLDTASYTEVNKDIQLKRLEVGNKIVLNNIFYDFDKATLRTESISELERLLTLMKENSTLQIEIASNTDSKGTDEYNQKLSQARAQSVVDYLIGKSISKERMIAKGYGETNPIATNDTDEGRQLNRRTEFKILKK
ncbi:MAG: PD40 domain-containing protein [Bacteroidetes bacterium]|nr:PD40 domain-containing protein [Bacteroidota bacterium]